MTKYALAEREAREKIQQDFIFLNNAEYVERLINSLPYMGAIMNSKRQVVFANESLLSILNLNKVESILGQRSGEFLHCVNSSKEIGGCGTSKNCSVCGMVNSMLESQEKKTRVVKECRINAKVDGESVAYDLLVTTTPLPWSKDVFYVVSMVDISSDKRKKALEKIFFHDVINKTGSMYGFIDLLKGESDIKKIHEFIDYLSLINQDLIEEINYQRDLSEAESGELKTEISTQYSKDIILASTNQIRSHTVANEKLIRQDEDAEMFQFETDGLLLRRVLMNMLKNALEATEVGGIVTIGCTKNSTHANFWVHNHSFIPEEYQMQIFQRSFSSKARNRGLGTYSMKLLGESYLKGIVSFTSDNNTGTTFQINIPYD